LFLEKGFWKTIAADVLPETAVEIPCFPVHL